jgi:hypothetical protein
MLLGGIKTHSVMPALVAGIHDFSTEAKTWIPGTRPGMTEERA